MTPALEYLIRSDLIKEWFAPPSSLFLQRQGTNDKLVVTIAEEFRPSDKYSVKHWNISNCKDQQALPAMIEYSISKKEIFNHSATIVSGYKLLSYQQESIQSHHNSYKNPMSSELYNHFFSNSLDSYRYKTKRLNWLWERFIFVYMPTLTWANYIPLRSEVEVAEDQRHIVSQFMKKQWQYWQKWQQYMLLNSAELIFNKEYLNT